MKEIKTQKHVFALLAIIYLFLEAQAWTLISRLYTSILNPESLSEYERFGYASAGIGITLLLIKTTFPLLTTIKKKVLIVALSPVMYLFFVWFMYELVHQSPNWIPKESRHVAAYAAIETLSEPRWSNLSAFYTRDNQSRENADLIKGKVEKMITQYPLSDRAVQATYIQGIKSIHLFSEYYRTQTEILEKEKMDALIGQINYIGWFDFENKVHERDLKKKLVSFSTTMNSSRYMPLRWPNAAFQTYIALADPLLNLHIRQNWPTYISEGMFHHGDFKPLELSEIASETYIWEKMREEIPSLPRYIGYYHNTSEPFNERFRRAYSRFILDKYTYMPDTEIPWLKNGEDPLKTRVYNTALKQVVPFFIDATGKPIITFERIYDEQTRLKYIRTLQNGLPHPVRVAWDEYQISSLSKLALKPDGWNLPTEYEIHKDALRIGAVIPVMVVFSGLLIIFNIVSLFRLHYIYGATGVVVTIFVYLNPFGELEQSLIKALIAISVRETQIFLY